MREDHAVLDKAAECHHGIPKAACPVFILLLKSNLGVSMRLH